MNMINFHPFFNDLASPQPWSGPFFPPAPPPPPQPFPPMYLFHYTDEFGMRSITEHGYIRKSYSSHLKSSAIFGEGVYLTAIPPDAPDFVIIANNWNCHNVQSPYHWNGSKVAKLQFCFAIPSCSLNPWALFKMWDKHGRDVWLYRNGITLGDRDVLLKQRW